MITSYEEIIKFTYVGISVYSNTFTSTIAYSISFIVDIKMIYKIYYGW